MKLAVFDIDGVLADDRHRVEFALKREWYKYFEPRRVAADGVWIQGKHMVENAELLGYDVAYMTGRRQDLRQVTEDWMDVNGFPIGRLIMRSYTEIMPLANFKVGKMGKLINLPQYEEVVLFDDDPEVIRAVRDAHGEETGIHCTWHIKEKALVKSATA